MTQLFSSRILPGDGTYVWHRVAYGAGKWVVLASNKGPSYVGINEIAVSTDNGVSWTLRTLPAVKEWMDVIWAGTAFIAVADDGSTARSSDAITWTAGANSGVETSWPYLAYNGSVLLVDGGSALSGPWDYAVSNDLGDTWTGYGGRNIHSDGVAWNGSVFCAIHGTDVYTSANGSAWTQRTMPNAATTWRGVACKGATICLVGARSGNNYSAVSNDNGASWTEHLIVSAGGVEKMASNGTTFFACPYNYSDLGVESADGITWETSTLPRVSYWTAIAAATDGAFMVLDGVYSGGGWGSRVAYGVAPPPPVPNNGDEIVFEALVSSPDTQGNGIASMPALFSFGTDVAEYGIAILAALTAVGAGTAVEALYGDGIAEIPALFAFGTNETVGVVVTDTGYGLAFLPALETYGEDPSLLVPSSGSGIANLPALTTVGAGGESLVGDGSFDLPALGSFGFEAAGDYGIAALPALVAGGVDVQAAPSSFATLVTPNAMLLITAHTVWELQEIITAETDSSTVLIKQIIERLVLTGTPFPSRDRFIGVTDSVSYSDALAIGWSLALSEGIDFTGTAQANITKLGVLIDILHATGAVANRLDAMSVLATVISINSMLATGWKVDAIDTVGFQDALAAQLTAVTALVDTAGFTDTATPSMRLTVIASETLQLSESLGTSLEAFEQLSDQVMFYTTLRLGDGEYSGWVMNEGAISEYRNYPFNGFEKFSNKYYGTARDGLYLLEGETDAGDPIAAHIKTALMDFGTGKRKRVPDVYVAFTGSNQLLLKVITTNKTGAQVENWYTATVPAGSSLHNGRIKPGRGLDSRYWQFVLANVNGADFDLDELAFRPVVLDGRL